METLKVIIAVLGSMALGLFLLTMISSADDVRKLVQAGFSIIVWPFEALRNACASVLLSLRGWLRATAEYDGMTGGHMLTRIAGAGLLTVFTGIGAVVSLVSFALGWGGYLGAETDDLIARLPVSIEMLSAVECFTAVLIFGMLLTDLAGITSITHYFSKENITSKPKRVVLTVIIGAGFIFATSLLSVCGLLRARLLEMSIQSVPVSPADAQAGDFTDPNATDANDPVRSTAEPEVLSSVAGSGVAPDVQRMARYLMVGIPMVSVLAGAAGFVMTVPLLSIIFAGMIFAISYTATGIPFLAGHVGTGMINLSYAFFRDATEIFVTAAERLKAYVSSGVDVSRDIPAAEVKANHDRFPEHEAEPSAVAADPDGTPGEHFHATERDWNPLA